MMITRAGLLIFWDSLRIGIGTTPNRDKKAENAL